MSIKRKAIIIDIDGTLADSKHREHHIVNAEGKVDWAAWDAAAHLDTPNRWCASMVAAMKHSQGVSLIFLTGRGDRLRDVTLNWLTTHVVPKSDIDLLLMRPNGDKRPDTVIKEEYYRRDIEPLYDVLFCIDDRDTVVDMFRKLGLTVLHCDRWGDAKEEAAKKWLTQGDGSYRKEVLRNVNHELLATPKDILSCAGMGLAGEAGECVDLVKKHLHHGVPFDREKMIKELGDVRWYLELMMHACNTTIEEVERLNVEKLRKRYPEGFTTKASVERADTKPSA